MRGIIESRVRTSGSPEVRKSGAVRRWASCGLVGLVLALAACGGGPREKMMSCDKAQNDRRALRVKIVAAYHNDRMDYTSEPRVGWVVDVDVLAGPENLIGQSLTLPYDDFALGKPPPSDGTELTITPADWMNPPGTVKYKVRDRDRERERR